MGLASVSITFTINGSAFILSGNLPGVKWLSFGAVQVVGTGGVARSQTIRVIPVLSPEVEAAKNSPEIDRHNASQTNPTQIFVLS
jgi:hypothetical protein